MSNDKVAATFGRIGASIPPEVRAALMHPAPATAAKRESGIIPDVWADAVILDKARVSLLGQLMLRPDPYARRGHYRRAPRWMRRLMPRRGWVWDESAAAHAERVAQLPPQPATVTFPRFDSSS